MYHQQRFNINRECPLTVCAHPPDITKGKHSQVVLHKKITRLPGEQKKGVPEWAHLMRFQDVRILREVMAADTVHTFF